MEIRSYLEELKEVQNNILNFLDNDENMDINNNIFDNQNLINNKFKMKETLRFISIISQFHHRTKIFFSKIEEIIEYLQESIKAYFSNSEIFKIFKNNKKIILFLFEKEIITLDDQIVSIMTKNDYFVKAQYPHYFYPELKPFISNQNNLESDIEEKRKTGFDDNLLCKLIRNDIIDEFIVYINQSNLSLQSKIEHSFTETHSYLIDKKPTLIEYAAFFGAIQIFKYLKLQDVQLTQSLWIYAIHGRNAEIINLLEENNDELEDEFIEECLMESIKCHHNEIVYYLAEKYSKNGKNYFAEYVKYFNFELIEEYNFDESHFYDFCQFDYQFIVEKLLESGTLNINKIIKRNSIGYTALHAAIINENIEIIKLLLSKPEINPNITNSITGFGVKNSPLALAVLNGNIEIVQLLLECKKINVNLKNTQPWYGNETNALIMAVENENIEIIKLLLEREDTDVNCFKKEFTQLKCNNQNSIDSYYEYKTPLVISIEKRNINITKLILNHPKVDVNLVCTKENLYQDYVNDHLLKDFHPYYLNHLTRCYEHLYHKNHLNEIKMIEDMPYIIKNTALSVAYSKGNFEIIKLLESNKNIDKSKNNQEEYFYLSKEMKELIGANCMIKW